MYIPDEWRLFINNNPKERPIGQRPTTTSSTVYNILDKQVMRGQAGIPK